MNIKRIIILFICVVGWQSLSAQRNNVEYSSSGYQEGVNTQKKDGFIRLVDDVFFNIKDRDTKIYGDSSLYYEKRGIMIVFGNVRIKEGDSVDIRARRLNYYLNDKKAELREDVVYTDGKIRLTTNYLDYFTDTEDARFYNGGTIVDDETTLKAQEAFVINAENRIKFYEDVDLRSPEYDLLTDTLFYDRTTKIATTYGPTKTILEDGEVVDAEGSQFYTSLKQVSYDEGKIETESYDITATKLFFDEIKQKSRAIGKVKMYSEEDNITIYGEEAETEDETGITKIWGDPVLRQIMDDDTLYLTADTLISIDSEIEEESRLLAFNKVKIFKSDLQGIADSLSYFMKDSAIYFYNDPVLWNEENQMTGDTIQVFSKNETIDQMKIRKNAFTVSQDTIGNFNQMKGKNMTIFFAKEQIDRIEVYGNGESIYFALDDKDYTTTGMNKIKCTDMKVRFINGEINDISFYVEPEGRFIPPHEIQEPETRLKDFSWRIEEKPTKKQVLNTKYDLIMSDSIPPKTQPDPTQLNKLENQKRVEND